MKKLYLYWCSTEDHGEDWFLIAGSSRQAKKLHCLYEGYDPTDVEVESELICEVPMTDVEPGWPSQEVLEVCGAKYLQHAPSTIVELGGKIYAEGLMQSVLNDLQTGESRLSN